MWLRTPAIINPASGELLHKINGPVEMQTSIGIDINIQRPIISGSVDQANIAGLHEVIGDNDVFLVRSDLDVVRPDGWLNSVGIIEAFDVVEITDVERGDMVVCREGEVSIFTILCDVGTEEELVSSSPGGSSRGKLTRLQSHSLR